MENHLRKVKHKEFLVFILWTVSQQKKTYWALFLIQVSDNFKKIERKIYSDSIFIILEKLMNLEAKIARISGCFYKKDKTIRNSHWWNQRDRNCPTMLAQIRFQVKPSGRNPETIMYDTTGTNRNFPNSIYKQRTHIHQQVKLQ